MSGLPGHGLRVELGKDAREPTSASSSPGGDVLTSGRRGGVASPSGRSMDSAYKFPASRLKTDQFFLQWLAHPENQELVWQLVEDSKNGKPLRGPSSAAVTPRSPRHVSPQPLPTPPQSPSKQTSPRSSPTKRHSGPQSFERVPSEPAQAVPRFYFPPKALISQEAETAFAESVRAAAALHEGSLTPEELQTALPSICEIPAYLAFPLFTRAAPSGAEKVSADELTAWWMARGLVDADVHTCTFEILRTPDSECITKQDLHDFMQSVLRHHPGLEFLQETAEFQDRYAETVIYRIFYSLDRLGAGRITLGDVKRSDFCEALARLDVEEDINKVLQYFSYEHFYVIYCKFWELDQDHDFMIDREDVLRYGNHGLTYRIVDRVFQQAPRPMTCTTAGKMGYEDFVYFILSEEDKTTDTSLAYWLNCVDLDADGAITTHDMRFFYEEQLHRMECASQVPVAFSDIVCQMHDMLNPEVPGRFTLRDLRRQRALAGTMFNILFNLNKFVAFETRDPFVVRQEKAADPDAGEWDRYARQEYIRLALEEEAADDVPNDSDVASWEESIGRALQAGATISASPDDDDDDDDDADGMEEGEANGCEPIGTPSVWS